MQFMPMQAQLVLCAVRPSGQQLIVWSFGRLCRGLPFWGQARQEEGACAGISPVW